MICDEELFDFLSDLRDPEDFFSRGTGCEDFGEVGVSTESENWSMIGLGIFLFFVIADDEFRTEKIFDIDPARETSSFEE